MAMAFTMYAGAVNLDAVDNEPEEVLAPPEAYNMVHHLTEDKTRGTSFRTYDLAENFYQGTFAFDSTLYSNFQFIPNPRTITGVDCILKANRRAIMICP